MMMADSEDDPQPLYTHMSFIGISLITFALGMSIYLYFRIQIQQKLQSRCEWQRHPPHRWTLIMPLAVVV